MSAAHRVRILAIVAIAAASVTAHAAAPVGVRLPDFEQVVLGNGAQVALMVKRDTPMVAMNVIVRGGSLADAPGREGTVSLLAELMQKGAGQRHRVVHRRERDHLLDRGRLSERAVRVPVHQLALEEEVRVVDVEVDEVVEGVVDRHEIRTQPRPLEREEREPGDRQHRVEAASRRHAGSAATTEDCGRDPRQCSEPDPSVRSSLWPWLPVRRRRRQPHPGI